MLDARRRRRLLLVLSASQSTKIPKHEINFKYSEHQRKVTSSTLKTWDTHMYLGSLPHSHCYLLKIGSLWLIKGNFFFFLALFFLPEAPPVSSPSLSHFSSALAFSVSGSLGAASLSLSWFWILFFFLMRPLCSASIWKKTSADQSFMAPCSLLHQKL